MVYGTDAMLPVEVDTPTWRRENFNEEVKTNPKHKIYIIQFKSQTWLSMNHT